MLAACKKSENKEFSLKVWEVTSSQWSLQKNFFGPKIYPWDWNILWFENLKWHLQSNDLTGFLCKSWQRLFPSFDFLSEEQKEVVYFLITCNARWKLWLHDNFAFLSIEKSISTKAFVSSKMHQIEVLLLTANHWYINVFH